MKKGVNWALRNIGKRNRALNEAAVACAERIRTEANRRAGGDRGGDPEARAARWVASDALRELTSEGIARLGDKEDKTSPRATRLLHQGNGPVVQDPPAGSSS